MTFGFSSRSSCILIGTLKMGSRPRFSETLQEVLGYSSTASRWLECLVTSDDPSLSVLIVEDPQWFPGFLNEQAGYFVEILFSHLSRESAGSTPPVDFDPMTFPSRNWIVQDRLWIFWDSGWDFSLYSMVYDCKSINTNGLSSFWRRNMLEHSMEVGVGSLLCSQSKHNILMEIYTKT